MFTTLQIVTPAFPKGLTVTLGGLASSTVAGPSGAGKTTTARAIDALLTGEAPAGWTVTGTTKRGTVCAVNPRTRTIEREGRVERYTAADAYRAALGRLAGNPDVTRLILHARTWEALLATPKGRGLRDVLLAVLPPADLRAVVAATMAPHALREGDPLHLEDVGARGAPKTPGALTLQREANAAASRAAGVLATVVAELERARAAIPAPTDEAAVEAARGVVEAADAWSAYDRDAAAWTAHDNALAAWKAREPGDAPAYDGEAHQVARMLVERLRTEEADAKAKAAAESARVEAEARAAREAEAARVRADAEKAAAVRAVEERAAEPAPKPTPTLFPGIAPEPPKPLTVECPECGHTWSPS